VRLVGFNLRTFLLYLKYQHDGKGPTFVGKWMMSESLKAWQQREESWLCELNTQQLLSF
jgi:hypothetical protein